MSDPLPDVSFHDAEVLAVRLNRAGPTMELDVLVFAQMPEEKTERLRFRGVTDLDLRGFNEQNVLFDLKVTRASDDFWDVTLESTYGLGGSFRCSSVEAFQA